MRATTILTAVLVLCLATGCSESAVLAGNGASMVIACALLWSTVSLGQRDSD
jgi:hypothetical protein